jgi:drug/metabolite transporter (DMT)-like permease
MNTSTRKNIIIAHLALLMVALIYGSSFLIAKGAMDGAMPPRAFIQFRVTGAAILFWALSPWSGSDRIFKMPRKDLLRLALSAVFGVTTNMLFFFEGLHMTTPVNASIMMVFGPIAVLIMGALLIGERITLPKFFGILLGAGGAILLILSGAGYDLSGLFQSDVALGNLFVLINATSYAVYLVIVKPLMARYNALFIIRWIFTFGIFFVLPFGGPQLADIRWDLWTPTIIGSVAFVIVGTTFLTYLGNIIALKTLHPATVGAYIYLQPLIASVTSLLFAEEPWSIEMLIGGALIFTGVYFVSFYGRTAGSR